MQLKLRHDGPDSNFAFKFNLPRYTLEVSVGNPGRVPPGVSHRRLVGRCRLPVSNSF